MAKTILFVELLCLLFATTGAVTSFQFPSAALRLANRNEGCVNCGGGKAFLDGPRGAGTWLSATGGDDSFSGLDLGSATQMANSMPTKDLQEKLSSLSESSLSSFKDTAAGLSTTLKSNAENIGSPNEGLMQAQHDFADAVTRQLSSETLETSKESIVEFGQYYASSLESTYKFSEIVESISSGKMLQDSIDFVTNSAQEAIGAVDFKQNSAFILLIASVFWGSTQKRAGFLQGQRVAEEKMRNMEFKLSKGSSANHAPAKSGEIEELRQKVDELQSMVSDLTAVTQQVTKQLEEARALASQPVVITHAEVPHAEHRSMVSTGEIEQLDKKEIGGADAPPAIGSTKSPSQIKGSKVPSAVVTKPKKKATKADAKATSATKTKNGTRQPSKKKTTIKIKKSDWTRLSESALKRKTVKDLTAYLTEKGVECTDNNGKTLKKDSLVGLVLAE